MLPPRTSPSLLCPYVLARSSSTGMHIAMLRMLMMLLRDARILPFILCILSSQPMNSALSYRYDCTVRTAAAKGTLPRATVPVRLY
jgi:hypothetical protein